MADRIIRQIQSIERPATLKEAAKAELRVAAYARVSTDHEDQETSLAAQTDYYKKKILEHPGWEFVEIYVDDGISGLNIAHREGFKRMIGDCLAGRIDLVLTKSISRFARNTVDTVTTIRRLREKGVGVYFEKENVYSLDSKGEFILTLMSSLAQEESRSISENVTWGQRKRMADGKVSLAYSHFLGYDKGSEKFTMVVNKEQAVTVRRIFRMFLQGYTPHTISKILTRDKVPTPGGVESWNQQTIRRMLSNEKYKGDALLQKEFTIDYLQKKMKKNEGELPQYYVEQDHEPIISPWLFDYVQKVLAERSRTYEYRYSGIGVLHTKMICNECGRSLGRRKRYYTNGREVDWWECKSHTISSETNCKVKSVYEELLLYAIRDMARRMSIRRGILDLVKDALMEVNRTEKLGDIDGWLKGFQTVDADVMLRDEEDIMMAVRSITVTADRALKFEWLDGRKSTYKLPKYSPTKGVELK